MLRQLMVLQCFFVGTLLSLGLHAKTWAFDVYLDDRHIGQHTFRYDNQTLTSQAAFTVKFLFLTAYQYQHQAIERWDDNCLQTLTANTVENDERFNVDGQKQADGFMLQYRQQQQVLPICTMTFAYWNPVILQQSKLLNPQNAEYLDVDITPLQQQTIQVRNEPMQTNGYQILGSLQGKPKLSIKVWYDQNQDWVALQSTTPEGYLIDYRLTQP